jgi:hypothetical protein
VKYFIDENLLAVGRALAAVRDDVVHPGHANLPEVPTGTKDEDWLPIIGDRNRDLILITRDRRIRTKRAEIAAFRHHGVRAFFLTGKHDLTAWGKLSLLVRQWDKIERVAIKNGAGPWAMGVNLTGNPRDIPLTPA